MNRAFPASFSTIPSWPTLAVLATVSCDKPPSFCDKKKEEKLESRGSDGVGFDIVCFGVSPLCFNSRMPCSVSTSQSPIPLASIGVGTIMDRHS